MTTNSNFCYLNLENTWPKFTWQGLVKRDEEPNTGAITLIPLPQAEPPLTELPPATDEFPGFAGIGSDAAGNLYIPDPTRHQIWRWDVCSKTAEPLPCFGGAGTLPGQLQTPRGILVGPRHALYIADSGNHRIQIVDLPTLQVRGLWGHPDPYAPPQPSDIPGRFHTPWDIVADQTNHLYVLDYGNRRVQKFTPDGSVIANFWETIQASDTSPQQPTLIAIAALPVGEHLEERLFILDAPTTESERTQVTLLVYQLDGKYVSPQVIPIHQPTGLVVTSDTLYLGDGNRVRMFDVQGNEHLQDKELGEAQGEWDQIAGLSHDGCDRILIHPGGSGKVVRLIPNQVYQKQGSFLAGPFNIGEQPTQPTRWYRLQAIANSLPADAHLRFFTCTSHRSSPPNNWNNEWTGAIATSETLNPGELVPVDQWWAAPQDSLDLLILNEPAPYLWLRGEFRGDGNASPVLHQIRLEYNPETWLNYLPALYQKGEANKQRFLEQFLGLFESFLTTAEQWIDTMPGLLDPQAAPDSPLGSWLDWLAGWLALELEESWTEPQRRQALANAFTLYNQRGTVEGLQHLIDLYTQATALIEEPAGYASLWQSEATSTLGFNTMLLPASAQGAVVGTTAILDQSHLIDQSDYGAPLFEDIAHQFCVQVYAADVPDAAAREKLQQLLDREKPAHTTYQLRVIEPQMRVGVQSRLGIDAIVAGPPSTWTLTESQQLGDDTALSESSDRQRGSRIGLNSRLGDITLD
jgi:phage tail-like protein